MTDVATGHVAIFVTCFVIDDVSMTSQHQRSSLLPSLRVYITFKVVLHLRPNVITFRTMITVTLKCYYI